MPVIVACDFFVVITATFRTLYVFVVVEIGSRRILHHNVTAHPTAEWTLQQFREALPGHHPYRFAIHDRDSIFSEEVDKGLANLGIGVLRTPVRAPKANSVCERLGGSLRRECLDFLIPFNERHLQMTVRDWAIPYGPKSRFSPSRPFPGGVEAAESANTSMVCLWPSFARAQSGPFIFGSVRRIGRARLLSVRVSFSKLAGELVLQSPSAVAEDL
jgi:transposase InsO family protein